MYKTSEKKKFNCVDSDEHWPKSIKKKIQWFSFLTIMEHTANKMKENNGLILSIFLYLSETPRRKSLNFDYSEPK